MVGHCEDEGVVQRQPGMCLNRGIREHRQPLEQCRQSATHPHPFAVLVREARNALEIAGHDGVFNRFTD